MPKVRPVVFYWLLITTFLTGIITGRLLHGTTTGFTLAVVCVLTAVALIIWDVVDTVKEHNKKEV